MKFLIPAALAAHALFLCQVASAQNNQAPLADREKFLMEKTAELETCISKRNAMLLPVTVIGEGKFTARPRLRIE